MDEKERGEDLNSKDVDATGRLELPSEDNDDATDHLNLSEEDEDKEGAKEPDAAGPEPDEAVPPDDGGTVILGPEARPEKPPAPKPGKEEGGDKTMILGGAQGPQKPKPPGEMDKTIMAQRNFPYLMMDREYMLSAVGQLRTRVQAFLETLGGR